MIRIHIARLVAALFAVLVAAGLLTGRSADADLLGQTERSRVEIIGRGSSLAERVGVDDRLLFAVHFGGDIHGNLDACG